MINIIDWIIQNWIPLCSGAGIGMFLLMVILAIKYAFKRNHTLPEIKKLIQDSRQDMIKAAEKQNKLYKIFNEIEGDIK